MISISQISEKLADELSTPRLRGPFENAFLCRFLGSVFLLCSTSLSAENEAAIARWKFNRARTEKEHRAWKFMVLRQFTMHQLSVGGPACSYNNDHARGRKIKIQPNPNYKLDPQHSVSNIPQDNSHRPIMTFRCQFQNDLIAPPRPLQPQQQQHSSATGYTSCSHLEQVSCPSICLTIRVKANLTTRYYNNQKNMGEIRMAVFFG